MKLTQKEYELTIKQAKRTIKQRTREIAYACLVKGERQYDQAEKHGISRAAVNQHVLRFWGYYQSLVPEGFAEITIVVPEVFAAAMQQNAAQVVELYKEQLAAASGKKKSSKAV